MVKSLTATLSNFHLGDVILRQFEDKTLNLAISTYKASKCLRQTHIFSVGFSWPWRLSEVIKIFYLRDESSRFYEFEYFSFYAFREKFFFFFNDFRENILENTKYFIISWWFNYLNNNFVLFNLWDNILFTHLLTWIFWIYFCCLLVILMITFVITWCFCSLEDFLAQTVSFIFIILLSMQGR